MKLISKFFLSAAMACSVMSASAVPAMPGVWRTITLADGTQVRAQLQGDEFCHYFKDADGICYDLMENSSNRYVKADFKQIKLRGDSLRMIANAERKGLRKSPARIGQPSEPIIGKKKGIIILVEYQDTKFGLGYNQKFVNGYVNGPLTKTHTRRGFVGTVKDYFLNQSNNQFELDFDVVGPYTLSKKVAYYGADQGNSKDIRRGTMILEAVRMADADVNFADYDWTGNGYVDQVYVLFAGHGQADGSDSNTIWPHESSLSNSEVGTSYPSNDYDANGNRVAVNTYACGPELLGSARAGIGTLCHEFAHCLGYPDMYDTAYGGNLGMSLWDLMDTGSYNGGSFCPPNFTAYEKWFAGWLQPTVLNKPTTVKGVKPQDEEYGHTYVIYNDAEPNEYYLLENRQNNVGLWDTQLPSSGLMITHVDYDAKLWGYNVVNTICNYSNLKNDHERLTLFCADNDRNANGKDTSYGDLYPYNGNNELTNSSVPAAVIYNGGTHISKPITNIKQNNDGSVDFDFMGGGETAIAGVVNDNKNVDNRVFSIDGVYLGNDINAVGNGVFIVNGKKVVK